MKSHFQKFLLASLALLVVSATGAQAAVILTLPTDSTSGSLQITNDINFTITRPSGGQVYGVVFDSWVPTSDGTGNFLNLGSVNYSVNGIPGTASSARIHDQYPGNSTDGYL